MKYVRFPVLWGVALSILILWGCSSSTTPSSTTAPPGTPPIGSTLTKVTVASGYPPDTTVLTVDSTPTTDPNSSGAKVLKYVETVIGEQDSTFQSIEPDGDLALKGEPWDEPGNFYVLPFATTATIHSSYVGVAGTIDLVAIHNGAGANYLLDGGSYATDSATLLYILDTDTTQYHYTYIPSLGILAEMFEIPSENSGQDPSWYWISSYSAK